MHHWLGSASTNTTTEPRMENLDHAACDVTCFGMWWRGKRRGQLEGGRGRRLQVRTHQLADGVRLMTGPPRAVQCRADADTARSFQKAECMERKARGALPADACHLVITIARQLSLVSNETSILGPPYASRRSLVLDVLTGAGCRMDSSRGVIRVPSRRLHAGTTSSQYRHGGGPSLITLLCIATG